MCFKMKTMTNILHGVRYSLNLEFATYFRSHCIVASDANSNIHNINTPVITTTDANNHESSTNANTSDDYNEDIEKTKSNIKEQIKRKLQEVEVLQKKLRRLEDL
ncbi:hypothetical protein EDC96DRAFT_492783 [Choanephora cucurbitarum]|nr:hypothetical protein EDC96DRAFT_492783 [Choanephora cucurbitarum]